MPHTAPFDDTVARGSRPDVLGAPFTAETIDLGTDYEGPVVATLVKAPTHGPTNAAVLHVHGYCDYFFQREYAQWWTDRGYTFYALDLRKYGRSLRDHQSPNHIDDLSEYYPELDEAFRRITERDGHEAVVVHAHSTGGLLASLWADERRVPLAGLVLNSPWLDMHGGWAARVPMTAVIDVVARFRPHVLLPRSVSGIYGRSIHADHDGDWSFDTTWKSLDSFPVRAGWMSAVRRGHRRLHRGLDLQAPVLVLSSARTGRPREMSEEAHTTDMVLDVEQIRRWAPVVGRHVTSVAIEGARHDVVLSRPDALREVLHELDRWLTAHVEERTAATVG